MQERIQHPTYGEILYTEGLWTGKKTLSIQGNPLRPVGKKLFNFNGKLISMEGSYIIGLKLCIDNETIEITPKPKWYEFALAMLPFIFLMIWGNNPSLCAIFPVVGGAIGGALGGLGIVASLFYTRKAESLGKKLLIGLAVMALTIFSAFVLALLILQAF